VLIALALGANGCLIGRPYIYGLAIGGADGVRQVIENIVAELDFTMALLGIANVGALSPDLLVPASRRSACRRRSRTVDAIAQVRDHWSVDHPDSAELPPMIKTVEEPDSVSNQDRDDVQLQLIDKPGR
jgi:FMN-dependent dehydrogenase